LKSNNISWSRVLDFKDLEYEIFVSQNLNKDCKSLNGSLFAAEDSKPDTQPVHFDPQVYANEIAEITLQIRILSSQEIQKLLFFMIKKFSEFLSKSLKINNVLLFDFSFFLRKKIEFLFQITIR